MSCYVNRRRKLPIYLGMAILIGSVGNAMGAGNACAPLTEAKKAALARYVEHKHSGAIRSGSLQVVSAEISGRLMLPRSTSDVF